MGEDALGGLNLLPMLDSYVSLLGIDRIILENTRGEPWKFLAEYGVFVFAITVGGNVLCVDTNDYKDGDASVLIADANFCSYNDHYGCAEIGIIPKSVAGELYTFFNSGSRIARK